jgi:hypothetical protein
VLSPSQQHTDDPYDLARSKALDTTHSIANSSPAADRSEPRDAPATTGISKATRAMATQPQNITAILAKVTTLQRETAAAEEEKDRLGQQVWFAREENTRGGVLHQTAIDELDVVHRRVRELALWRDEHACAAPPAQYVALEDKSAAVATAALRVRRKEEHVAAVLGATQELMAQLQPLRFEQQALQQQLQHGAGHPHGGGSGHAARDYLTQLQRRNDEQAVRVARLQAASEDHISLENAIEANEGEIRAMRGQLELAGVAVPDAPVMHRMQRLVRRAAETADSRSHPNGGEPHHHGGGAPNAGGDAHSLMQIAAGNAAPAHASSRTLTLPVGVLRDLTNAFGRSLREVAASHDVSNLSLEIQTIATLVHVSGTLKALDAFESALTKMLAAVETHRAGPMGGILSYGDPFIAADQTEAAKKIRAALDPAASDGALFTPAAVGRAQARVLAAAADDTDDDMIARMERAQGGAGFTDDDDDSTVSSSTMQGTARYM